MDIERVQLFHAVAKEVLSQPDDLLLTDTGQISGKLTTLSGQTALFETYLEHDSLKRKSLLHRRHKGPGIYLTTHPERAEECGIPLWIIIDQQYFTVGRIRAILDKIDEIVTQKRYVREMYWPVG